MTTRSTLTLFTMALVAALAGAGLYQALNGDTAVAAGPQAQPPVMAPGFSLADASGKQRMSSEWDGKYQLINFWATWCPPCRREIPLLVDLQNRYAKQGLQVIGIAVDQPDKAAAFAKSVGMNYPNLVGEMDAIEVAAQYGNSMGALPYTIMIGPDGKTLFSHLGELVASDIDMTVKAALPAE